MIGQRQVGGEEVAIGGSERCLGTSEASATTRIFCELAGSERIASIIYNHVRRIQTHLGSIRRPAMKLRQRRRLRRVDNIVSVLDSALQRQIQSAPATTATKGIGATQATTEELAQTAQGQRMLNAEANTPLNDRRHGRGPRQGEILSGSLPTGTATMTGDQARKMGTIKLIERWKAEMPTEAEMLPRDKYTMFDRKEKKYRKGIHKLPKWTRVSQRLNPPGF
ncbi:hypothetical protein D6D06_02920 [Aureobasidium pullulans]|nr:hypothetical protein D6D06_02920 [Aureobasidium pullulans]